MNQNLISLSILSTALVGFSCVGEGSESKDLQDSFAHVSFSKTISASASTSSGESTPSEPEVASSRSSSISSTHEANIVEDVGHKVLQRVPTQDELLDAIRQISENEKDKKSLLALYENAKPEGAADSESQYKLGCAFLRKDEYSSFSLYWMEQAAKNATHPNVDALTTIGRYYEYGLESLIDKDSNKALDYYERAWAAFKEEYYFERPLECEAVRRYVKLKIERTEYSDHPHPLLTSIDYSNFFRDHEDDILNDESLMKGLDWKLSRKHNS